MGAAVANWLTGLGRPVRLVLEDIHWADPGTLELLRQMAPRLARLPCSSPQPIAPTRYTVSTPCGRFCPIYSGRERCVYSWTVCRRRL